LSIARDATRVAARATPQGDDPMSVETAVANPVLPASGVWQIDPVHSSVTFAASHLVVSTVRGRFGSVSGRIKVADVAEQSSAEVEIDASSIDTGDERRDGHLRSAEFLDVEHHPQVTFRSTRVERIGEAGVTIEGDLTLVGVTRPVVLSAEFLGLAKSPWGPKMAAFSATAEIDRDSFGLTWNQTLDTGGLMVGRIVHLQLDLELVRT
jgi:polyisoprenoid-binding protein YceI